MSDDKPQTPEEAMAIIREAADKGNVRFADDTLTAQYNVEIQIIFKALYWAKNGKNPKRGIWTSNEGTIGFLFDWDPETKTYSEESRAICKTVGDALGVELTPDTIWHEAGAALRAKNPDTVKS